MTTRLQKKVSRLADQEQDIRKASEIQVIVDGMIAARHENLKTAKVLCFWTKKPLKVGGRAVAGKVKKVSDADRSYHSRNTHFIITVSEVNWKKLTESQQSAAVDELLCGCWMSEGNPVMVAPDFRGYLPNLLAYGFWQEDGERVAAAAQKHLPGMEAGGTTKSKPGKPAKEAVATASAAAPPQA
ncbi:MAG TPA: putative metallopeptidase [Anaerolineae bacterium]|nr:putative metallopeptidase [Anaerolineae bacterium]